MKVIGKDRTSCDVCNPIDEILARLDALERRASAIVAKVQGLAPDGEGNVTLPTSSSDTDPLHGRIDAFAMSSEVKEAANDAHAYAASIADDVIVINSEIDALNQAVAALQPAEIEAIKLAVQTLQTTVATLESTVATLNNSVAEKQDTLTAGSNITISGTTISAKDTTYDVATQSTNGLMSSTDKTKLDGVDSALAGKVSKSGDTMTGLLKMEGTSIWLKSTQPVELKNTWTWMEGLEIRDVNEKRTGDFRTIRFNDGTDYGTGLEMIAINPSSNEGSIAIVKLDDGTSYGVVPSWKPGTNDNSSKILNIMMANSLPSLVHTTGNETINGIKTFSSSPIVPATPSSATGSEIATANWVITQINELATKNGLNGL